MARSRRWNNFTQNIYKIFSEKSNGKKGIDRLLRQWTDDKNKTVTFRLSPSVKKYSK